MKKLNLLLTVLLIGTFSFQASAIVRCAPEQATDIKLYSNDFHWGMGFTEMMQIFAELVKSGKRLPKRAYLNLATNRYLLPSILEQGEPIELPKSFIRNIRNHVEIALQRNYADAIMFPDMGHSHFLIPQKKYDQVYKVIPNEKMNALYEGLFKDEEIQVLYHTAEQLATLDTRTKLPLQDRYLQWRFHTRNLVGDNKTGQNVFVLPAFGSIGNTAEKLEDHYWWGGFDISASETGCFPYQHKGQTLYFDLSLHGLEPDPGMAAEFDQ